MGEISTSIWPAQPMIKPLMYYWWDQNRSPVSKSGDPLSRKSSVGWNNYFWWL